MVNCPRCTFLCENGAAVCQMCQAPISSGAALDLVIAPWVCPRCTFVNECGPEKCEACDGPRPEMLPTPVDYDSAVASLNTELEQHDVCDKLARSIIECVPLVVDKYTALESLKKKLENDVSVFRESRHAALLFNRSTIKRIVQVCHLLKSEQLEEAAVRCSNMNDRAIAKAVPCIELANKICSEKALLSDSIYKTTSQLQVEIANIPPSPESILMNVVRPIKECISAAQKWLETLPARRNDVESLKKQLEAEQLTHKQESTQNSESMIEERISKTKNDPANQDSSMPITPRGDDTGNNLIKKAGSLSALEKNSRLLLINSVAHICNELAHISEVSDRLEQFSSYIQEHFSKILHKPRTQFGSKEVNMVQRFALDGKLLDLSVDIAKKTCELNLMTLHQIPEPFILEAQSKISAAYCELESVRSKLASLPPYIREDDPWALLPVPVKRSGLASFCHLDEYIKENNPLSARVSRCLLHEYEPCVLKQFDLNDQEQAEALAADVYIRSSLQESCIFIAPINAVFVMSELGQAYIESPVYEKGNAEDWLKSKPQGHEVRHLIVLLLRALSALNAKGICHGNLHARNVLLVSFDFSPVLIDFSRARHYTSLNMDIHNSAASDTWNVAAMLYSYLTDMELVPGLPLGPLPIDTPESVRELLDALISGNCSASNALDLTFCSGDTVKEMLASRHLVRLTSDGRIHQFQAFLQSLNRKSHDFLVTVERDNSILYGMITALETAVSNDLLMNFRTKYSMQSSQGIDQGGLTADLFTEFFVRVVSPSEHLFESAPEEDCPPSGPSYLPNPQNFSLSFYAAIGKAMCKALIDGRVVPLTFSSAIMKFFLDIDPDLSDLYDYDRTMANSFRNMMMSTISVPNSLDVQYDLPLPCNRKSYVHEKIKHFLIERRRPQLEALKTGFFTLTGLKEQCLRLAPEDLRILICGVQTIDATTLLREVIFEDSWGDSVTPVMVVDVLKQCPEHDLRRFLRLCTSLSCLPIGGLHRKITIRKVNGTERLPVGHTCFHTLDMPDYGDEEVVRSKMHIVLSHIDHVGFGYA